MACIPYVPTKLKVLRGNPAKRAILPEPEPRISETVPEPPEYLQGEALAEWQRLAPELHALGLLTVADPHPFASYCILLARWIEAERALAAVGSLTKVNRDGPVAHPLVAIASNAARDMMAAAIQFGLTPAARRRLAASATPKASKFSGLAS